MIGNFKERELACAVRATLCLRLNVDSVVLTAERGYSTPRESAKPRAAGTRTENAAHVHKAAQA